MRVSTLFENQTPLTPEQITWFKMYVEEVEAFIVRYGDGKKVGGDFHSVNGKIETIRNFMFISNYYEDQDPLPEFIRFGKIRMMTFIDCQLETFDILPYSAQSITFRDGVDILSGSLKGISKTLKECERIEFPRTVKKGLLDLMLIKGLKNVVYNGNKNGSTKSSIELAVEIINTCLKEGKDIFECQEMLQDRKLEKFA